MCLNVKNGNDAHFIGYLHRKPIVITFDVEHHLVVGQDTCAWKVFLNLLRRIPDGLFRHPKPVGKRFAGVCMNFNEIRNYFDREDAHYCHIKLRLKYDVVKKKFLKKELNNSLI